MVYDDDTTEPGHQDIGRADRVRSGAGGVPKHIADAILRLRMRHSRWTPEDIREEVEDQIAQRTGRRIVISLDVVHAVLQAAGRLR